MAVELAQPPTHDTEHGTGQQEGNPQAQAVDQQQARGLEHRLVFAGHEQDAGEDRPDAGHPAGGKAHSHEAAAQVTPARADLVHAGDTLLGVEELAGNVEQLDQRGRRGVLVQVDPAGDERGKPAEDADRGQAKDHEQNRAGAAGGAACRG